jgi:hypothetical protein
MQRTIYRVIRFTLTLCLIALLAGFLWIGYGFGNGSRIIVSALSQRMRVERMTKDALLLSIATTTLLQRSTAVSEIQNTLPLWEKVQTGLLNGDSSLGLPVSVPSDIAYQVTLTNADFIPLDTAFTAIEAKPNPPSPVQMQIIMAHEYLYFIGMSQVNILWRNDLNDQFQQFFWIEEALTGALAFMACLNFYAVFHEKTHPPK